MGYLRSVFRGKQLESVFLFVTSSCNSLCRTCFYWDELNQGRDLTFQQIERLSRTAPPFHKLWISGGEPFLRKELAEIIELFYVNNGARHVNLPTNGLLPQKVDSVITALLARCHGLTIDLNFSLDGLANTHDTLRGVPKNFEKTMATLEMAAAKWGDIARLRRNVVSCVTRDNYRELVDLGRKLMKEADLDGYYCEIVRGDPMDPDLKRIPSEERPAPSAPIALPRALRRQALRRPAFARSPLGPALLSCHLKFHFDLHEQNHYSNKVWPMPWTAGQTTVVIGP